MAREPWKDYCCPACYAGVLKARAWAAELKSREVPYTPAPPRPPPKPAPPPKLQPPTKGCVFAKSCTLPNGVIEHNNPNGFVPLESLNEYGTYAVLGTMGRSPPPARHWAGWEALAVPPLWPHDWAAIWRSRRPARGRQSPHPFWWAVPRY